MIRRRILWISDFPVEYLPGAPEEARALAAQHPLSWQRVLLEQLTKDEEFEIHVAVLRKTIRRDVSFQDSGAHFHLRRVPGGCRAPLLFWPDTWRIRRLVREIRPEAVHAWGSEKGASLVASRLGLPYAVTIQGLMQWYAEAVPLNAYERFAAWVEKWSLKRAPLVTVECAAAGDFLRKRTPGLRLATIEHAPDPLFFQLRREPPGERPRLLFVGSLEFRKGGDLLLAALQRLAPVVPFKLAVAGAIHPELEPAWKALVEAHPDRIELLGRLTPEQVGRELSRATLLVLPTRADTSPNAVKEAAVAGVPVIATRVGGIPDYIVDGANGLLIPPNDGEALITALRAALAHPLFSRGELDPAARDAARRALAPGLMCDKFGEVYRILAPGAGDQRRAALQ